MADDERLFALAKAIADGQPVDWLREESGDCTPSEKAALRKLAEIARLIDAGGAPAGEPDTGPRQWGPLHIRAAIGRGAFGAVYRAWDPRLDREVALKLLDPVPTAASRSNFSQIDEGRLLARVRHENVVTVFGADQHDGIPGLWMELVRGKTLKQIVTEQGPFSPADAAVVAAHVCKALGAVHQAGLIHRDIKAQNVMREADGRIILMDFGAGADLSDEDGGLSTKGTPLYLAPELFAGARPSRQCDIYSLGVLIYYLVSGKFPVTGPDLESIRNAHQTGASKNLREARPDLPASFVSAVDRALAPDPFQRFVTAGALLRALTAEFDTAAEGPVSRGGNASAVSARAIRTVHSIVAMPCQIVGSESHAFLTDAIPNTLSAHLLATGGRLEVKRPPTSLEMQRAREDVDIVASAYGVDAYVQSSLTVSGDRATLLAQLVGTTTKTLLWSAQLEGETARYPDLLARIAGSLAATLNVGRAAVAMTLPAADRRSEFDALMQRGAYHFNSFVNRGRADDFDRALEALSVAVEHEPERPEAVAAVAALHAARVFSGGLSPAVQTEAERWARRALDIDPKVGRAWSVLAVVERARDPRSFGPQLEYGLKAATFEPRDPYGHIGLTGSLGVNSFELALAAAQEATRLDPLALEASVYEAVCLSALGRDAEAVVRCDEALAVEPDMLLAQLTKAIALNNAERSDDAARVLNQLEPAVAGGRLNPGWFAFVRNMVQLNLALRAGHTDALTAAAAFVARMARGEERIPRWEGVTAAAAFQLSAVGMMELALDVMESRRAAGFVDPYDYLLFHPRMRALSADSRYQVHLDVARERFRSMLSLLDRAGEAGESPAYLREAVDSLMARIRIADPRF